MWKSPWFTTIWENIFGSPFSKHPMYAKLRDLREPFGSFLRRWLRHLCGACVSCQQRPMFFFKICLIVRHWVWTRTEVGQSMRPVKTMEGPSRRFFEWFFVKTIVLGRVYKQHMKGTIPLVVDLTFRKKEGNFWKPWKGRLLEGSSPKMEDKRVPGWEKDGHFPF